MAKQFTGKKTKDLKIFENDIVKFDHQPTEGIVTDNEGQWIVLGEKGHKWDLDDCIQEGITIVTSFNQQTS